MNKKIDRRVQYTKRVLKESLAELLTEKTIEKITVKEICETADINRGTFYSHYSDQYDLYNSMIEELLDGIMDRLGNFMVINEAEVLKNATLSLEYIKQNAELVKVLLEHGVSYKTYNLLIQKLKVIYENHSPFENVNPENVNIAYTAFTASSIAVIRYWLETGTTRPCEELAEMAFNSFHKGFTSLLK